MTARKTRHLKMWVVMVLASAALILGHGFYRDLSANNEETYKGLKLFSDVIELVQKNYVDEVDTQKMIEAAIQGMVRSLDPHSALLPPDAIPAILPEEVPKIMVSAAQADAAGMGQTFRVIGVNINGESRAYPIPYLSAHEIVNDVVGGQPIAATW